MHSQLKKTPLFLAICIIFSMMTACGGNTGDTPKPDDTPTTPATPTNEPNTNEPADEPTEEPEKPVPECTQTQCLDNMILNQCNDGKITQINCSDSKQICKDNTCTDDNVSQEPVVEPPKEDPPCTQSICDADGHTLHECIMGTTITADCQLLNMTCENGECVELPCESGTITCDGDVLKTCVNGKQHKLDCAASNQFCNAETFACDEIDCNDDYLNHCADVNSLITCVNHKVKTQKCPENHICAVHECIPDPCAACTPSQLCINETCVDDYTGSLIGIPCKCQSDDCYSTITSDEFKNSLTNTVIYAAVKYLNKIGPDDNITFPNYFSPSIRGCEALQNIVPEGMAVGCFSDSSISFSEKYYTFLKNDIPAMLKLFDASASENLLFLIDKISTAILEPTEIPAPNGYCMTAAIDLDAEINQQPYSMAVKPDALSRDGELMSKINIGDPSIAIEAASDSYCPEGSSLFTYNIQKNISSIGDTDAKVAICLQSCQIDDDCFSPYTCMDIPLSLAVDEPDAPTKKACFHQDTSNALKTIMQDVTGWMNPSSGEDPE